MSNGPQKNPLGEALEELVAKSLIRRVGNRPFNCELIEEEWAVYVIGEGPSIKFLFMVRDRQKIKDILNQHIQGIGDEFFSRTTSVTRVMPNNFRHEPKTEYMRVRSK